MGRKKSDLSWTCNASKWADKHGVLAASVDRIINQVEQSLKGKTCVKQVGRGRLTVRLAEQLMWMWPTWIYYSSTDSEHRPAATRMRAQLFRAIATRAEILKDRMLQGKSVERAFESNVVRQLASKFPTVSDFSAFLVGLDRTIDAGEDLTQLYEGEWVQFNWPPKDWLIAKCLPLIFKNCFRQKARASKTDPYIRFAAAVMAERGLEKYSDESIRRALTRPPRRKRQPKLARITVGLDIANNVFEVHGIDASEKVVVRKQLRGPFTGERRGSFPASRIRKPSGMPVTFPLLVRSASSRRFRQSLV